MIELAVGRRHAQGLSARLRGKPGLAFTMRSTWETVDFRADRRWHGYLLSSAGYAMRRLFRPLTLRRFSGGLMRTLAVAVRGRHAIPDQFLRRRVRHGSAFNKHCTRGVVALPAARLWLVSSQLIAEHATG